MSTLDARLAELRRRYAATLPAMVAQARAALDRVDGEGAAAIEELWHIVHRIYGTAGSHGLDAVATEARSLEALLTPHRTKNALPAPEAESAREGLDALAVQADLAART